MATPIEPTLGARLEPGGVRFRVWAPTTDRVEVVLEPGHNTEPNPTPMTPQEGGYHEAFVPGLAAGALYRYRLDGENTFPDPASRFQPSGVHGPSMVVDPGDYDWRDSSWQGVAQRELVFYELHVGTFTPEGTYRAAQEKLPYLKELGVTALELMPLADFPGRWNWGYDPAAFFAPSRAYGTPGELRALVDHAHELGLAVYLDVVYNHFGPDGAYAVAFSPYFFTDRHQTPWGQAINLDGEGSAGVRRFFLENAVHWLSEYHFDGFRLDATFALIDDSPKHFLTELSEVVAALPGWPRILIAEDPRNLRSLIEPVERGGYGLHGTWADDFHHQVRSSLAGDNEGYYRDFSGSSPDLAATVDQGWFYTGQYSQHADAPRGTDPTGLPKERFVFCVQNHDQVGNRPLGNRLSDDVTPDAYRAASALLLFAPELPLLFMGQEWAASSPFQFFTDHNDELGKLVSAGRKKEFEDFSEFRGVAVPDPQDPDSYQRSKLDWDELSGGVHHRTLTLYRDLLALRKTLGGDVRAAAPVRGGVVLEREDHTALIALEPGVSLEVPAGYREVWRSETPDYAEQPEEIVMSDHTLHFPTRGAVIFGRAS